MAEISVVWLLFLGLFMVVVSSGVLAASQWEKFPAAGQYAVLLAYTLTFWAILLAGCLLTILTVYSFDLYLDWFNCVGCVFNCDRSW